ncbi:MAG: ABC transporter ATP-binding protein [Thiotrichales bacterium SG8_50]|nr:MAG: ABC transporter ATP-binding protein [Thiotrichales bacterium SG8_50]
MLKFDDVSLRRGPRLLFSGAAFQVFPGQKVGLTGANGVGKSSLFALIRRELEPDAGEINYPHGWVLAHVAQETPALDVSALDYVIDGDRELRRLQRALADAERENRGETLAELHGQLEIAGGYTATARAGRLLHGLGFSVADETRSVGEFSGGWRMRLNLAQALMCRSDLLLLDEPTNHLDLDAVIWLEQWLRAYAGTLLLISHDREFLDRVVGHIAHIEAGQVTLTSGNYSAFELRRAEQLAQQQAVYEKQQREIAHIEDFVRRFRAKATKARQAQSRLKTLQRMAQIAPAHVDSPFHFAFGDPEQLSNPLLRLHDAELGYPGKVVVRGVELSLAPGARIGVLGRNGAGKSTLVKTLAGELEVLGGARSGAKSLRVGYFAQHQLEQLRPDDTPLVLLQRLEATASEQSLRDFLGGFGFTGDRAFEHIAPFSGGEKARLVLASIVYQKPNVLLLDEPTNHLDLEMRHALTLALQEFAGAIVVVAHDRHLLRAATDRFILVADGAVTEFDGDLDDYARLLASAQRDETQLEVSTTPAEHGAAARKQRRREEAAQRHRLKPLRQELARLEAELGKLTAQREALDARLADAQLYSEASKAELRAVLADKADVDRKLGGIEEAWLATSEALESQAE